MGFDQIVENRFNKCKEILIKKESEYSKDNDRFHNFYEAAELSGTNPEDALWGMMVKHLVSVKDLCKNPESVTKNLLDEKITDSINYLLLLEGLLCVVEEL